MAPSAARHLFLAALVAVLAVAGPRPADAWAGGRFFFSKTTRAETAVEQPEKQLAAPATAVPNAADTASNAAPSFTAGGGGGRGYGLYGRPEENYPGDYFRRGVHRNAEKLTSTGTNVPAATTGTEEEEAPVRGGGQRARAFPENGSGRGRPPTDVPATATSTEEPEAVPVGGAVGQPYPENGSGRGRPPWYYTAFHRGRQQEPEQGQEPRDYGMSDTRLYQNGRYYYDVDAGRYGYGRESNPMRTRPDDDNEEQEEEEFNGSGYGRPRGTGGRRGGRYGNNAAGYQRQYGVNDNEFGNGAMDQNTNGFQEEGPIGRYVP